MSKKVTFITLGCRVNQYESDSISESIENMGIEVVEFGEPADLCIINTCSVTAESDRKSRQMIRKAIKTYNNAYIVVCGCSTENNKSLKDRIKGITVFIGNADKPKIPNIVKSLLLDEKIPNVVISDINEAKYDNLSLSTPRRIRSYIKIEDGCENKCAYCIIPSLRGKVRSRDFNSIIKEAKELVNKGCKEIVLTGIETASYGFDLDDNNQLDNLVLELNKIEGIERITFGSLCPTIMKDKFLSTIVKCNSVLPHFHISLQSGCSNTLKSMRRKYNATQAEDYIANIRNYYPDAQLSADIIVGFPGETDYDFNETYQFLNRNKLFHVHVFPYSIRTGTEAERMSNQIPEALKQERVNKLLDLQKEVKKEILEQYNATHLIKPMKVLIEQLKNGYLIGHSEHNIEVRIKSNNCNLIGTIVNCTSTSYIDDYIIAKI